MRICKVMVMDHRSHVVHWVLVDFLDGWPESRPLSAEWMEELSLSKSVSYASNVYLPSLVAIVEDGSIKALLSSGSIRVVMSE